MIPAITQKKKAFSVLTFSDLMIFEHISYNTISQKYVFE